MANENKAADGDKQLINKNTAIDNAKDLKNKKGFVEIEFLKDHGTYVKGDTAEYHASTCIALLAGEKPIAKKVKDVKKKTTKVENK